jgi:hypothetical protein
VWLVRASSAAPNFLNQRRKQAAGGALFFGYFLLSKQKQSDSLRSEKMVQFPLSPLSPTPLPLAGEGLTHIAGFDFKPPAAAPSIAGKAGVFGEDCLSAESASSAAARFGEKHREAEGRDGGCLFVWVLYFGQDKQNKVARLKAKKCNTLGLRCANKHQFAHPVRFILGKQK